MREAEKIKVAMVMQSYLPRLGGAERQLDAVSMRLKQVGFQPFILTRRYRNMEPFEVIHGIPVYRVPAPAPQPLAAFCFLLFGLLRLVKEKPNLIHAYELLSPTDLSLTAKSILKTPLVIKVLRGGYLGDLHKLNTHFMGKGRISRVVRSDSVFIAISREIQEELIKAGVDMGRIRFVPNGVDTSVYQPIPTNLKAQLRKDLMLPGHFVFLYSGRLSPEKNLDWLLNVWGKFQEKKQATLMVIGSGPAAPLFEEGTLPNVRFEGYVDHPQIYYQAADAFVLPSKTEGLSNALLEAMACGLPVIATNVGAAPEVVNNGENGFLIHPGDSDALLLAMEKIYTHPKLRREFGQKGRERVNSDFSLDCTVQKLVGIYDDLLQSGGSV